MKKTAVEWLAEHLCNEMNFDYWQAVEKAKLIEIDQMRAIHLMTWMDRDFDFEQYIKDNYKQVTNKN
jgi:hypothetical protein